MPIPYAPTDADVARYRRLRAASVKLSDKLVASLPKNAFEETAAALGILREGVLEFGSQSETSVLSDACLYAWYEDGVNVVERYAQTHPQPPGSDEEELLDAYGMAVYRIIEILETVPGAGFYCRDLLAKEELFVMDFGFSRTPKDVKPFVATRTIPLGEFWMTGGAALPIADGHGFLDRLEERIRGLGERSEEPGAFELACMRTCLETGSQEHVRYLTKGERSKGLLWEPEGAGVDMTVKRPNSLPPKRRRLKL